MVMTASMLRMIPRAHCISAYHLQYPAEPHPQQHTYLVSKIWMVHPAMGIGDCAPRIQDSSESKGQ